MAQWSFVSPSSYKRALSSKNLIEHWYIVVILNRTILHINNCSWPSDPLLGLAHIKEHGVSSNNWIEPWYFCDLKYYLMRTFHERKILLVTKEKCCKNPSIDLDRDKYVFQLWVNALWIVKRFGEEMTFSLYKVNNSGKRPNSLILSPVRII